MALVKEWYTDGRLKWVLYHNSITQGVEKLHSYKLNAFEDVNGTQEGKFEVSGSHYDFNSCIRFSFRERFKYYNDAETYFNLVLNNFPLASITLTNGEERIKTYC